MKITFTGKQDKLSAAQERKMAMAFHRLSKLLERRGEKVVQVAMSAQRHLQCAEIRLNFYDQALVGAGAGLDQFTAVMDAVDKVEKQALKLRAKWRDTKRTGSIRMGPVAEVTAALAPEKAKLARKQKARPSSRPAKVVKASAKVNGKPMTIDEAMLAIDEERDYVVYRDAETDKVSVLVRRRDGKVDLIEA